MLAIEPPQKQIKSVDEAGVVREVTFGTMKEQMLIIEDGKV